MSARYDDHRKDNQTLMTMGSENDVKKEQLVELNKLVAQAEAEADDSGPAIRLNMDAGNEVDNDGGDEIDELNNNNNNDKNDGEIEGYTMGMQVEAE